MTSNVEIIKNHLRTGQCAFLSGGAGVGKTHLIRQILKEYGTGALPLASTGLCATALNGYTLHRFFRLGISKNLAELKASDLRTYKFIASKQGKTVERAEMDFKSALAANLQGKDIIIVDEISVISSAVLELIHYRFKWAGINPIPILYVGDFHQLPPVYKRGDTPARMAFESPYWNPKLFELTQIKRTQNIEFAEILKKVRVGVRDKDVMSYLKTMDTNNTYDSESIHLFATNNEIDNFNIEKLRSLEGKPYRVSAIKDCSPHDEDKLLQYVETELPVNMTFYFKIGAKVIFTTNKYDGAKLVFANGERGTIDSFDQKNGQFKIIKDSGETVFVDRELYAKKELKGGRVQTLFSISQFPLRIGYAISIHKSQGMTLQGGHLDCKRFFLPAQFYVALSRFADPDKVTFSGFSPKLIGKDASVIEFYENARKTGQILN